MAAKGRWSAAAAAMGATALGACSLVLSFDDEPVTSAVDAGSRIHDGGGFVDAAPGDGSPVAADAAPMADACVADSWVSLLENGGLEAPTGAPWTQSMGNGGPVVRIPTSFMPHMGSKLAIFTFGDIKSQYLRQVVDVPATADALRFRGQRCFIASQGGVLDTVDLEITAGGQTLGTFHQFSNADGSSVCNWSGFDFTEEGDFGGQSLRVGLEAQFDLSATAQSTFLFDTMVLEARVCE